MPSVVLLGGVPCSFSLRGREPSAAATSAFQAQAHAGSLAGGAHHLGEEFVHFLGWLFFTSFCFYSQYIFAKLVSQITTD